MKNIGDKVKFKDHHNKIVEGEIVKIDDKQAKYHVFSEELGHARKGVGTHACVFIFEDVEKLNP